MTGPVAVGLGETWPRLDEFVALGATHRIVPVVRRVLADTVTPVGVYRMLAAGRPGTFILESAQPDGTRSRFSFVGVRSRATLTIDGDGAADVLSVNDLDDFARWNERLVDARRVVLLGGGLIGCEFANDLLSRDVRPTVVDLADRPLGRLLPPEAAAFFQDQLEAAGVVFRLDARVTAVQKNDGCYRVRVADGSTLNADVVLSAVGLRPRTALAEAAGCRVARGIVTDRRLETSVPGVYAVGDCAEVDGLNLPFVMPILHQARALAATLTGTPTVVQYPVMPVLVKTPACPTVVCPPPAEAEGQWRVEGDGDGLAALFEGEDGQLLGFALVGKATARRQELAARVPRPLSD